MCRTVLHVQRYGIRYFSSTRVVRLPDPGVCLHVCSLPWFLVSALPVFQNVSKRNVHSRPAPIRRSKGTNHNKELHPLDLQSLAKDQAATNLHVFTQVCASCCQAAGEATLRMGGNLSPGDL